MSAPGALSTCLVVVVLLGCPSPHHGDRPLLPDRADRTQLTEIDVPEQLVRDIRETNDGYETLKTVHRVTLRIALDGGRSENLTLRGILAIKRPAQFRLIILGPASVKLAELLYNAGDLRRLYLAKHLESSSRLPAILDSIAGDIRAIYRLQPVRPVDQRQFYEGRPKEIGRKYYHLRELRGSKLVRTSVILADTLAVTIVEERRRSISYSSHERRKELLLPRTIHLKNRGAISYTLSIEVESVDVNVTFDSAMFEAQ